MARSLILAHLDSAAQLTSLLAESPNPGAITAGLSLHLP